jgi:hypothetical protein
LAEVVAQLVAWAKEQGPAVGKKLAVDAAAFVADAAADMERWARLAAEGQLTVAEVEDLVRGQGDLAKMRGLTELGLTLVVIEEQRLAMLNAAAGILGAGIKALSGGK